MVTAPEGSHQTTLPMAVARADSPHRRIAAAQPRPFIPISSQCRVQLGFEKLLDEASNARAHPIFQGIKPIIEKKMPSFGGTDR